MEEKLKRSKKKRKRKEQIQLMLTYRVEITPDPTPMKKNGKTKKKFMKNCVFCFFQFHFSYFGCWDTGSRSVNERSPALFVLGTGA